MFKIIYHKKIYFYFLIGAVILNLSILFLNKNKLFYSYKTELNFYATYEDISDYHNHEFTIINYLKEELERIIILKILKLLVQILQKLVLELKVLKIKKLII